MNENPCPDCGTQLESGDNGEPDYIGGWWCDECKTFWTDDDLEMERIPIHDGKLCENCGKPYMRGNGQLTVFGGWFCGECLD